MRPTLLLFSFCLVPAMAAFTDAPKEAARTAAEKGLTFLASEGVGWKQKRNCVSCHHGPAMLWSLNEAKRHGYAVDDKALTEVTEWVNAADDRAKGIPAQPKPTPSGEKNVRLVTLTMALGVVAGTPDGGPSGEAVGRYLNALRADQRENGSWAQLSEGRLPIVAQPELMTMWGLLALTARGEMDAPTKESVDKGMAWLNANTNATDLQSTAIRLLLRHRLGRPREELKVGSPGTELEFAL